MEQPLPPGLVLAGGERIVCLSVHPLVTCITEFTLCLYTAEIRESVCSNIARLVELNMLKLEQSRINSRVHLDETLSFGPVLK